MDSKYWPFFEFVNVGEGNEKVFVEQCRAFTRYVQLSIESEDLAVVLDQAHAIYQLRCHAFDLIVDRWCEETVREDWTRVVCQALTAMLTSGPACREELNRCYDMLLREDLAMLTIARVPEPQALRPHDQFGWKTSGVAPLSAQVAVIDPAALRVDPVENITADVNAAIKAAVEREAEPLQPASWAELTESQKAAMEDLRHHWKMARENPVVAGISPRPIPLIAAASGCGKTFLVRHFAQRNQLPILELDSSSWIVHGATNRPYTLESVAKWITENSEGLLMLDELDKCEGGADAGSSWNRHVRGEIFSLLDRRLGTSLGWDRTTLSKLDNFLIVGIGTWQSLHRGKPPVGFGTQAVKQVDILQQNNSIPEELLFRFNSQIIYLTTPSVEEFAKRIAALHTTLAMAMPTNIAQLARDAVTSALGVRWLEGYLSQLLRRRHRSVGERIVARLRSAARAQAQAGEAPNDI